MGQAPVPLRGYAIAFNQFLSLLNSNATQMQIVDINSRHAE